MAYTPLPQEQGSSTVENDNQTPLQCVPYARDHSSVKIFGDAYTWWDKAQGHYLRSSTPSIGAVMVLSNYSGSERGHLAVVRTLINPREIRVDHANWLDDGSIYLNDPVMDVSPDNDWSIVRVYNLKIAGWGGRAYPVQGFIGGSAPDESPDPDLGSDKMVMGTPIAPTGATSITDLLQ